jgi:hypothetical protein
MKSSLAHLGVSCLALSALSAADYYVAPGGSDGNTGTQVSPWATIAKAMTSSASNDRIYLARGGTWRETFTIGGNRQLLAYGSGADPVITGSRVVTMTGTWGSNSNVRTGSVGSEALSLWVNGSFQPLARYPNSGYLNTATGTSLNSITGSGMPSRSAGRWSGAQVRWHRWHWFWETRPITTDGGGATLTLSSNADTDDGLTPVTWETGLIGIPSGFYIDKDLDELDAPGEWFSSASLVYVYPPAGVDGGSMTVEVATNDTPISVNSATIRGIAFRRFHGDALQIGNPSTIEDCTFEQIGNRAINTTYNSGGTEIRRNLIRDVLNCGIVTTHNPSGASTVIERNLLHRIGMVRGYGGSGTWKQVGILSNVGTSTITLNRIVDTGYAGILLGNTAGNTATRNLIVRSMSTSNDGAGIYTYKGPNTMNENIVLDSLGSQVAAEPFFPFGNGIWPEFLDGIANSQINDNTIAGCNGSGIALINNFTCSISRNVLFDNLNSGLQLGIHNGVTSNQDHTMDDNVFATLATTRRLPLEGNFASWYNPSTPSTALLYENGSTVDFGLLRRSTFVTGSGTQLARGDGGGDPVSSTLSALATAEPSWVENTGTTSTQNAVLLINDTEAAADLAVPSGTWTRTDGSAVGAMVNLNAFRSIVLIGSGAAPVSPIYQTASGVDWRQATPTTTYLIAQQEIAVSRTGTPITDGGSDSVSATIATQATTLTFTISNLGTAPLNLTLPVSLGSTSNCSAAVTTQPSGTIAAGGTGTLVVSVTPTTAAAWSFTISVINDDADENPFNWTVSGTATPVPQPEIAVSRGPGPIADGATDTVGGTTSLVAENLTYTIANTGTATLTIGTAALGGLSNCSALIVTQPAASVAAGGSTTLVVRITPSGATSWSCPITFTCNDPDEDPTNWTIQGTATLFGAEIALSRGATAIADGLSDTVSGSVAGSTSILNYTIANTGSIGLTVSPPTLSSLVNCTASITANPVSPVNAFSGTTGFTIQVTPTSAAAWSLNALLVNNDGNENPTDWTIQGTATSTGGGGGGGTPGAEAGGGGCGAGSATAAFLLAGVLGLGLRRRRR